MTSGMNACHALLEVAANSIYEISLQTKVSHLQHICRVMAVWRRAARTPGDILGRSLSNIELKTAQACTVDRTPEGVQMPVTQHLLFSSGES